MNDPLAPMVRKAHNLQKPDSMTELLGDHIHLLKKELATLEQTALNLQTQASEFGVLIRALVKLTGNVSFTQEDLARAQDEIVTISRGPDGELVITYNGQDDKGE